MVTKTITTKDVAHVAKLARLSLSDAELEKYTGELGRILEYVNVLNECDTSDVTLGTHAAIGMAPLRPDGAVEFADASALVAAAPETAERYVKTKAVFQ